MAKSREVFVCDQCGNESLQWQGLCPMCGAGDSLQAACPSQRAPSRSAAPLAAASAEPQRLSQVAERDEPRIADRHGGARSGARRRPGARLGHAAGRRPRHRQVDDAAAGGRRAQPRDADALRHGRRIAAAGQPARAPTRRRGRHAAAARGDFRRHDHRACAATRGARVLVIDSIQTMFATDVESSPGSAAQVRESAAALVRFAKSIGRVGADHRSRHQGRRDRRAAHPRAHGGHGAVLRERCRQPLPPRARGQESLRRRQRSRRVRDDRARA